MKKLFSFGVMASAIAISASAWAAPGCMDSGASNYDPAATEDDGSCLYATSFNVDMTCAPVAFATVHVTGPWCGWCAAEAYNTLSDTDGDGIYSISVDLPAGQVEYKYMVDSWAHQENLVDDMQNGATCAPITDYAGYANRLIVALLEAHDERLRRLEARSGTAPIEGTSRFPDFQGSAGLRPPSSVPELASIGLPDAFDIRFGPTSSSLGLNAQMQLSEVIELLGRYPQLRVVCTGHTDAEGDRGANIALSRKRAEAVRTYLLQSGVRDERVLLNFFGEERAMNAGAADRRVEVAFFAN